MAHVMNTTRELEKTMRARFGADISLTLARCPAFGDKDVCFIVNGANHKPAAAAFTQTNTGAKVATETGVRFKGETEYTYSVVTMPGAQCRDVR